MFKKLFKRRDNAKIPTEFEYCGELFPQSPRVKLLANNKLSLILTDVGASYMRSADGDITKFSSDLPANPKGSFCFVSFGSDVFSTTITPCYNDGVLYETAFLQNGAVYFARASDIKLETRVFLHPILPCEQRELIIENRGKSEEKIVLLFCLEPASADFSIDYEAESNTISALGKGKGGEESHCVTVGFLENISFEYTSKRENIFENFGMTAVKPDAFTASFPPEGDSSSSCIGIRVVLKLSRNERKSLCMLTFAANSRKQAISNIIQMREQEKLTEKTASQSQFRTATLEHRIVQVILPQLLYNKRDSSGNLNAIKQNRLCGKRLEELGISLDFPIAAVEIYSKLDVERADVYLKCHSLLKAEFIYFSLVLLYDGDKASLDMISSAASKYNEGGKFEKSGLYIIEKRRLSEEMTDLIFAAACHIATRSLVRIEAISQSYKPFKLNKCNTKQIAPPQEQMTPHVLENERMSAVFFDRSIGFTEVKGAEKLLLTAECANELGENGGELLIIKLGEEYYDIINGSTPEFTADFAVYNALVGELLITTSISLEKDIALKRIDIEVNNTSYQACEAEICLYTRPVIGKDVKNSRELCGDLSENVIILTNDFNNEKPIYMGITSKEESFKVCFDRPLFLCGRWETPSSLPQNDNCTAVIAPLKVPHQGSRKTGFGMAFSESQEGLAKIFKAYFN